jgi:hypothetical protein
MDSSVLSLLTGILFSICLAVFGPSLGRFGDRFILSSKRRRLRRIRRKLAEFTMSNNASYRIRVSLNYLLWCIALLGILLSMLAIPTFGDKKDGIVGGFIAYLGGLVLFATATFGLGRVSNRRRIKQMEKLSKIRLKLADELRIEIDNAKTPRY